MPDNKMREIRLEKVVLNIGIGDTESNSQNAKTLLEKLTGHKAAFTVSKHRQPELNVRKGQIIGSMVTLRGEEAAAMLKKTLDANDNLIKEGAVTNNSLSFGIKEYIYIAGVKYDPKIGMLGLNVNASFSRRGRRVEKRKRRSARVPLSHRTIGRDEIERYLKDNFKAGIATES